MSSCAPHPAFEVVAGPFTLGESPLWDPETERLLQVDIEARKIYEFASDGSQIRSWTAPDRPTSLGLTTSGRILVGLARAVAFLDRDSGQFVPFVDVDISPHARLNDGKVGPDGAFWIGSMDERTPRQPIGVLLRISPEGQIEIKAEGVCVSNGLAWSPDARTMYHSDTRGPWIDTWRFDRTTGAIGDRSRFSSPKDDIGRPDGGTCDAEGYYWSAGVSAGRLNRFDGCGQLVSTYQLPVAAPTMPCFGGPDLSTLFVTSLRLGISDERLSAAPLSGSTLALNVGISGMNSSRFRDCGVS